MRDKDLTLQTDEGGTLRSPSSVFVLCLSICPRPGGSHFQQSWQLFRIDRGRPSLQNPRFQAFRAQNCHFCALLSSETPIFGISSTKSRFLCAFALRNPHFQAFRAQNRHFCVRNGDFSLVLAPFEHKIGLFVLGQTDKWHREV